MSLSTRHVYTSSCMKFSGWILTSLSLATSSLHAAESWPPVSIEQHRSSVNDAAGRYQELRERMRFRRPTELSKNYHESGQYLGYGELKRFAPIYQTKALPPFAQINQGFRSNPLFA